MKSPNVVWISTHDINPDLGCYAGVWPGAEYALTPNLDRVAADGARFDQARAIALLLTVKDKHDQSVMDRFAT